MKHLYVRKNIAGEHNNVMLSVDEGTHIKNMVFVKISDGV